jgi:hypothetical protein
MGLRPVLLDLGRAHLLRATPIDDGHRLGAQHPRLGRGVDRGISPADHHDMPDHDGLGLGRGLTQQFDEAESVDHIIEILTRNAERIGVREAQPQKHRVEALPQLVQRQIRTQRRVIFNGDAADPQDEVDFAPGEVIHHLIGRDAIFVEAARLRLGLEHHDLMPEHGKPVGAGETRRPGAHNRHALARQRRTVEGLGRGRHEEVGRMALQGADGHGLALLRLPYANLLAEDLGRTDARAAAAEDIALQDRDSRAAQIAGADFADESGNVDAGRAGFDAGRIVAIIATISLDPRLVRRQRRRHLAQPRRDLGGGQPAAA